MAEKRHDIKVGDVFKSDATGRNGGREDKITEVDKLGRWVKWQRVKTGTIGSTLLPGYKHAYNASRSHRHGGKLA